MSISRASAGPHLVQAGEAEHAHLVQDEAPVPVAVYLGQVPVQVLADLLRVHTTSTSQPPILAYKGTQVSATIIPTVLLAAGS